MSASKHPPEPIFRITYWGCTGTLPSPLTAADVAAKLRALFGHLSPEILAKLSRVANDPAEFERVLQAHLPVHVRSTFGGNTTCVEVQTPDALLILDCGSGFRELGVDLARRWRTRDPRGPHEGHVLITHPHMDHTFGTPYFEPYQDGAHRFTLYGSPAVMKSLDAVLVPGSPLSSLYFPLTFSQLPAIRERHVLKVPSSFHIGRTTIHTTVLRHPGGCVGFRLECDGRSFVFCTDTEPASSPDAEVAKFAQGADLLYLDGQYLEAEYEGNVGVMGEAPLSRRGWGHGTVETCAETAAAAGVRQLHVGHHDPKRDDADLARVESCLQQYVADALKRLQRDASDCQACLAREGMQVVL
jgi:phosphoribosyl 1,2-cyclic phosphodiesterase